MPRAATAAVRSPSAVRPKVLQMNKSDSILHKKSSSSGAAAFPAAETDQNGKKVGICAIAGSAAGFSRSRNARTCTMNVVHGGRSRRFCPVFLYARQNRGPQSYIFRFFHHLKRCRHPFKDRTSPNPPSAPAHGYTWCVLTPRDGSEHGKKEKSSKEGSCLRAQA